MVTDLEPNVYHLLEGQTDVASLKGIKNFSKIPKSKELDMFLKNPNNPRTEYNFYKDDLSDNLLMQKLYILQDIKNIKSGTSERFEIQQLQNKIDRALPIINNPDQLIGRIDPVQTVDQVIQSMKEEVKKLKAEIKGVPKKMEDQLALYEKALDMIPDIIKNSPYLAKQKTNVKGMPIRYLNEAFRCR